MKVKNCNLAKNKKMKTYMKLGVLIDRKDSKRLILVKCQAWAQNVLTSMTISFWDSESKAEEKKKKEGGETAKIFESFQLDLGIPADSQQIYT